LHLSEDQFEITTPGWFASMLDAYYFKIEQEDHKNREAWERCRIATWYNVQLQIEKSSRQSIKKFMPFPWDADAAEVDVEEMRQLARQSKWITHHESAKQEDNTTQEQQQKSFDNFLSEWHQLRK
jgi:nucleoside-specific outer membrane channel protein Tsx